MVVARPLAVSLSLVLLSVSFSAVPATACHRGGDLCLPCESDACDIETELDLVKIVGKASDYPFPEPMHEGMHFDGLDADERRGYLAVQFEWATDDHMPPPGHGNVPFALEFAPEAGVAWDSSTSSSFTFTVNDTRETLYFGFTAPRDEVDIDWRIVANPGPNQQEDAGTLTYESYDPTDPDDTWGRSFQRWWPAYLLFLLVGLLLGIVLGRRRPLP